MANNKQHNQEQQQHEITVIEETPQSQVPQEKTVIQETLDSQLQQDNNKDLKFLSPPMVITISSKTPEAINTSTPTIQTNPSTTPKQYNTTLLNPVLYKIEKNIQQENICDRVLKMTQKQAKFNFRDTGFLANTTAEERNQIIVLPKSPMEHSKCRARQQTTGPNVIPGLTSPAQHLSPVALFTSAKQKMTI